jgi:hypothetical protein
LKSEDNKKTSGSDKRSGIFIELLKVRIQNRRNFQRKFLNEDKSPNKKERLLKLQGKLPQGHYRKFRRIFNRKAEALISQNSLTDNPSMAFFLYDVFKQKQRPTSGLPSPTVLRLQVFSTS